MPYKCYTCGEVGHNKRTCKKKLVEPVASPSVPVMESNTPTKVKDEPEECPICYNPLGSKDLCITECGHKFCMDCVTRHLCNSTACPMCRSEIVKKPISSRPASGPGSDQQIGEHSYQFGHDEGYDQGYYHGREESMVEVQALAEVVGRRMIQTAQENIRLKELLRENNKEF